MVSGDILTPATVSINTAGLTSSSGNLIAGAHTGIESVGTLSGADAGNYTFTNVVGDYVVTPASLSVSGITAANKVYDGSTIATINTGLSGAATGDSVSVAVANGAFSDRNVGTGKTVSISGMTLGGTDAANYILSTNTATTTANIIPLASVTWTGGTNGNWSNASNWAGGALPDGNNVLAVIIPSGVSVTYDAAVASTVLPSFTTAGNVALTGTNLSIGSFNQTAGNLTGTGILNVTHDFSQTGGTIALTGAAVANITQTTGDLSIASLSAPTVTLAANTGSILGQLNAGSAQLTAATGIGSASTAFQLVASSLNATTSSGGINLTNTPAGAVTLIDFTTGDASSVTYSQNGQDLTLTGTMSSVGGSVIIDPPANVNMSSGAAVSSLGGSIILQSNGNMNMSNGATVSSGGGAIGLQATGNVVLANINAGGNGAVNLSAGGNVYSAPGYSGANITGGLATLNVGGSAAFNTQVQMLDATVAGSFTITDASGTIFSSAPPQIPQIPQLVSTLTAPSPSSNASGSLSGNVSSTFIIPSYVTGGGVANPLGGTTYGTIGGTAGTFGDSEISAITATGSSTDQNKDKSGTTSNSDSSNGKSGSDTTNPNNSNGKSNAKPNKC